MVILVFYVNASNLGPDSDAITTGFNAISAKIFSNWKITDNVIKDFFHAFFYFKLHIQILFSSFNFKKIVLFKDCRVNTVKLS